MQAPFATRNFTSWSANLWCSSLANPWNMICQWRFTPPIVIGAYHLSPLFTPLIEWVLATCSHESSAFTIWENNEQPFLSLYESLTLKLYLRWDRWLCASLDPMTLIVSGFHQSEFHNTRPKPLVTPFLELRYTNSHTRSMVFVDPDLSITILYEHKFHEMISTSTSLWTLQRFYPFWAFACELKASKRVFARTPCGKFSNNLWLFGSSTLWDSWNNNLLQILCEFEVIRSLLPSCAHFAQICALLALLLIKTQFESPLRVLRWNSEPSRCTPCGPFTLLFVRVLRKGKNWNSFFMNLAKEGNVYILHVIFAFWIKRKLWHDCLKRVSNVDHDSWEGMVRGTINGWDEPCQADTLLDINCSDQNNLLA
jgi:hypothetical protein